MTAESPDLPMPIPGMLPPDLSVARVADPQKARVVAISRVLVTRVRREEGLPEFGIHSVRMFRLTYLPEGRLLRPDEVERWVAERVAREGEPDRTFYIAVHPEDITRDGQSGEWILGRDGKSLHVSPTQQFLWLRLEALTSPGWLELEYATPSRPVASVPVRTGGALDALRRVAGHLAVWNMMWTPAQAATFALTGLIPYADAFARALEARRGRRPRAMSAKHLELAVFTAEHEGETLAARLAEWNAAHPDWAYKTVEHFGGDSRLAIRRLVEEGASANGNE